MSIFFKSEAHKKRFLATIQQHIEDGEIDLEYGAAIYILTADMPIWDRAVECVEPDAIHFRSMLNAYHFSTGESVLVRLASNLFSGEQVVEPIEFLDLDPEYFDVAMQAIRLRRNGLRVDEI